MNKFRLLLKNDITNEAMILIFVMLAFVIGLLIFFIVRGIVYSRNAGRIKNGMSYDEVIEILGDPCESAVTDDIKTCVWKTFVLRGWTLYYTIVFKTKKLYR